ncbi:hypothetical protein BCR33DRAFT_342613 [Rhizoclosmatium globosum]|uniref:C2H2-type domain-containing protein n=1 Tax=Rhizoclosmatium globosum TaxID=329046 RepID=A0A1Y2C2W8_9FUNG|nr:hypothetical protein BCR33DRAFT_342613 [Rhizoclosmatium globosum]|eukprot:ORY41234.1 hypothetical protein BCR33DRAFT_342613 [Rhizoclosmatium globosum]
MRPVACASKISHNLEINPCTPPITAPGTRNVSPVDFSESPEDLPLQYIPEPECPGEYIDPDLKKELLEQHSRTIKAAVAAIAAAELASQSRGKTVKQKAVSKPLQPKKTGSPQIVPKPPAKAKESSGDRRSSLRFQTPVDSEEDIIQQENVNTSTQSIKCLICHKPYGSKNGLKYHMNKQHAS